MDRSIHKINTFTNLRIGYETIRRGKGGKIVEFIFTMQEITDEFLRHVSKSLRKVGLNGEDD